MQRKKTNQRGYARGNCWRDFLVRVRQPSGGASFIHLPYLSAYIETAAKPADEEKKKKESGECRQAAAIPC
jgi:hypothetical protein